MELGVQDKLETMAEQRKLSIGTIKEGLQTEGNLASTSNCCHVVTFRSMLEIGMDVNSRDSKGRTATHFAASRCETDIIQLLSDHGSDLEVLDDEGRTALDCAVVEGHSKAVRALISCGARIEEMTEDKSHISQKKKPSGENACYSRSSLMLACKAEKWDIVELLVELGANVNSSNANGMTPLHYAAAANIISPIIVLLDKGADINRQDKLKRRPILFAAAKGYIANVEYLLNRGCDSNCDYADRTPLHVAAAAGQKELVKYLLDWKGNVNHRDLVGNTAVHYAALSGHPHIVQLLVNYGADMERTNKAGHTPLMSAVLKGHTASVQMLLQLGAQANPKRSDKYAKASAVEQIRQENWKKMQYLPIFYAVKEQNAAVFDEFLLNETDFTMNMNSLFHKIIYEHDQAPLSLACTQGYTDIVRLLLDYGADINRGFRYDEYFRREIFVSPLFSAIHSNHVETAALLLDRGVVIPKHILPTIEELFKNDNVAMVRLLADRGIVFYDPRTIAYSPEIQQCFPSRISVIHTEYYSIVHYNRKCNVVLFLYSFLAHQIRPTNNPIILIDSNVQWNVMQCALYSPLLETNVGNNFCEILVKKFNFPYVIGDTYSVCSSEDSKREIVVKVSYGKYNSTKTKWRTYCDFDVVVKVGLTLGSLLMAIKEFIICFNTNQLMKAGANEGQNRDLFKQMKVEQEMLLFWTEDERAVDPNTIVGKSKLLYCPIIKVFPEVTKRFWLMGRWHDAFYKGLIKDLMYQRLVITHPMMSGDAILCVLLEEVPFISDLRRKIAQFYSRSQQIFLFDHAMILDDKQSTKEAMKGNIYYAIVWKYDDNLEQQTKLGGGSFGIVYRYNTKGRKNDFALKKIKKSRESLSQDFVSEIIALAIIGCHPNVVSYTHLYEDTKNLYIRMPLMQMSLQSFIKKRKTQMKKANQKKFSGSLGENEIFLYSEQILCGLYFLHNNGIVHMDLSTDNILLESERNVKVSDFSLAKYFSKPTEMDAGKYRYAAPEVLLMEKSDLKADIWSFGAVIIEMITGNRPYGECPSTVAIRNIIKSKTIKYQPFFEISDELKSMVDVCIGPLPENRPSCLDLMMHRFFCRELPTE